jgi:hypothetical protein
MVRPVPAGTPQRVGNANRAAGGRQPVSNQSGGR